MLPTVACIHRGLFRSCAGLSVRMTSRGIGQKGILANRVAVVTGSTDGIGFAIARRLARDGAHVVVSSRKQQNVDRAVAALQGEGLSVVGTVCHVGKAEDRERLVATVVEHCGGLDFLVCSAGVNPLVGSTLGASEQVWEDPGSECEGPGPDTEPAAAPHGEEGVGCRVGVGTGGEPGHELSLENMGP
ncbi:dehydrogenase/reductase SDR family member 2, mitochondrial isoform X1 [Prionailurus bengalensis]|uniref:dehydrogenase/reductase SDR family member 2, mitochondrial isoform X1 n=1 Tax=Prionailurus bengalensis TaxID=37029 RepID=UPI001CA8CE0D|nr:dehydrogenase/reductase SDR family member 2, mitochondrial isoform X1 [Prionailurus bengalensis]